MTLPTLCSYHSLTLAEVHSLVVWWCCLTSLSVFLPWFSILTHCLRLYTVWYFWNFQSTPKCILKLRWRSVLHVSLWKSKIQAIRTRHVACPTCIQACPTGACVCYHVQYVRHWHSTYLGLSIFKGRNKNSFIKVKQPGLDHRVSGTNSCTIIN